MLPSRFNVIIEYIPQISLAEIYPRRDICAVASIQIYVYVVITQIPIFLHYLIYVTIFAHVTTFCVDLRMKYYHGNTE